MGGTIIRTIKQNCRRCYTCVRDCPAKAIRIEDGQAFVVDERCIACGNCTLVCSQNAKAYLSGTERALWLLNDESTRVAALLAPSFPAGFAEPAAQVVGAFKAAGFDYVVEVAQGADLVSRAYKQYLEANPTGLHIATACPAVAEYVRKYHPELTGNLVPIVSPMIATALAVKELFGQDVRCVFVGPCVAKKAEARDPGVPQVIDEVLTLQEAHRVLAERGADPATAAAAGWDEPVAGRARVFPLPGGLLESAGLDRGILDPEVLVVSGQEDTIGALDSLGTADTGKTLLVEALMCKGCYCGPGVSSDEPGLLRKRRVGEYVADSLGEQARRAGRAASDEVRFEALLLTRSYSGDDQRCEEPSDDEIREILAHTNKFFPEDELNCRACGYPTCRAKAVAVHAGMAEEAMCLPFMIEQAERVCNELNVPWNDLRDVHRHIINTEKLASMGQMAAGVAHELNNPLSTILLYSHILNRKLAGREDLGHDLKLVAEESERCKKIVGNLLDFARQSRVHIESVDVEGLVRQAVDGAAATIEPNNGHEVTFELEVQPGLRADLDRDQVTQVLVNLVKNGAEAMEGRAGVVRVSACDAEQGRVHFAVSDEGNGIAQSARDKVFQPFFTTKSIGKGTGLGLPISYGIVKMHQGTIWFNSEIGQGTTFHIELPKSHAPAKGV